MTSLISIGKAYARKKSSFGHYENFTISNKIKIHWVNFINTTFAYQKSCPKHDNLILVDRAISPCNGNITIYVYVGWITNTGGFNKFHQLPKLRESPKSPAWVSITYSPEFPPLHHPQGHWSFSQRLGQVSDHRSKNPTNSQICFSSQNKGLRTVLISCRGRGLKKPLVQEHTFRRRCRGETCLKNTSLAAGQISLNTALGQSALAFFYWLNTVLSRHVQICLSENTATESYQEGESTTQGRTSIFSSFGFLLLPICSDFSKNSENPQSSNPRLPPARRSCHGVLGSFRNRRRRCPGVLSPCPVLPLTPVAGALHCLCGFASLDARTTSCLSPHCLRKFCHQRRKRTGFLSSFELLKLRTGSPSSLIGRQQHKRKRSPSSSPQTTCCCSSQIFLPTWTLSS